MTTLIAYHNDISIKSGILAELEIHRKADALEQGYGYWNDGKGCAVGCTIKSGNHIEYESRFGIPVAIARLEDAIFEGLPVELARAWPERLMSAIRPGQDLSRVHWRLLHWLLTTPEINPGIDHPLIRDAVKQCADLMADLEEGKAVSKSAADSAESAARSAADSAARSARSARSAAASAAWSAARSARSARSAAASAAASAASAAWSAESAESAAAWSAARSARSARSAAWVKIADKLIDLIEAAPMAETSA